MSAEVSVGGRVAEASDRAQASWRARALPALLGFAVVESFVHYTDNTIRYRDYVGEDPSFVDSLIPRWLVAVSWFLFTVAGVIGYRRFRQGRWPEAAGWIGAYSVSGLASALHYLGLSLSDLSAFQNTFVLLDVILGVLVGSFAVSVARRPPGRAT